MKIISFLFILTTIYCSGNQKKIAMVENTNKCHSPSNASLSPVVFVHGFKGSELIQNNKTLWLTPSQGLGFSSPDISLKENDGITAGYPITKLELLFGLISFNIYENWLNSLTENKNIQPYVFTYDWRKDNNTTRDNLLIFLDCIKTNHNGKSPIVIGHSNGGNLTLSAMNKNPKLLSGAVIVGAPIRGGIGFMEDLIPGVSTGLNNKISGPCVVSTFEPSYTFFPDGEEYATKDLLLDKEGNSIEIDFFNSNDWKKFQLGYFHNNSECKNLISEEKFQKILDRAKIFKNSLKPNPKNQYPKILLVYAENSPTLRSITGIKSGENWMWNFQNQKKAPGDGRVTKENAQLPPGMKHKVKTTKYGHGNLLDDPDIQKAIFDFIKEEG